MGRYDEELSELLLKLINFRILCAYYKSLRSGENILLAKPDFNMLHSITRSIIDDLKNDLLFHYFVISYDIFYSVITTV